MRSVRSSLFALVMLAASGPAALGAADASRSQLIPAPASELLPQTHEDRPYWRRNLFTRVLKDQKYLVTTWWPQEFQRLDFAAPVVAGTLAGVMSRRDNERGADLGLGASVDARSSGSSDQVAAYFTKLGNGTTLAFLLGTTYLTARIGHHDRLAETSSLSAESLLNAGIWVEALKLSFARVRPNESHGGQFFQYGQPSNGSFPSGHAMGAFAVATVFAQEYRDKRWMPWVAYGTAGLISTSRIALGRHFPTDVLVGAMLGNSIGRMVVARQGEDDRPDPWTRHLTPIYDPASQGYGVAYSKSW